MELRGWKAPLILNLLPAGGEKERAVHCRNDLPQADHDRWR